MPKHKDLLKFQKNPVLFCNNVLNQENIWDKLEEIMISVRDNKFTIVKSGHGIGKTYISASIVLWFLYCFPSANIITTAPTARQVEELLWKEISKQHFPNLGGNLTTLKLKIDKDWYAIGLTTRESVVPEKMAARFQGWHAPHLLFIFDEAAGVHSAIWTASKGCLTGSHSRFLAIGNPTSPMGDFYKAFKSPLFNKITVSCFEHPNVKLNKEVIPGAVTKEWIEERKEDWGEDSPLYQSRVLAQFPDEGEDTLISLRLIEAAIDKKIKWDAVNRPIKAIGVDVARFGTDKTVITVKEGEAVKEIVWLTGKDTNWTLAKTKEMDEKYKTDNIVIDDTGVGGGVTDGLKNWKRLSDNLSPVILPINNASAPTRVYGTIEFENIKAEMFWILRNEFINGTISIIEKGHLVSELSTIKYDYTPGQQKIFIVSKKTMKKLGFDSPDFADSLVLAHWGTRYRNDLDTFTIPSLGGNLYKANF